MSMFFVAFAIIVIVCANIATNRNASTKAAAVVATTSVVAAKAAPVAHTQDVCDPINVLPALVMVLAYTKATVKANRLAVRRARSHSAHKVACAHVHAVRMARKSAMQYVSHANAQHEALCAAKKAHKGASWQAIIAKLYSTGVLTSTRTHMPIVPAVLKAHVVRSTNTPTHIVVRAATPSIAQHDDLYKIMNTVTHTGKGVMPVYMQHKTTRPTARMITMRHAGKAKHMALVTESREAKFMGYINAMISKGLIVTDSHKGDLVARATNRDRLVRDSAWAEVKVMMAALYRERSIKTAFAWHNKVQGYSTTCQELAGSKSFNSRMEAAKWMAYEDSVAVLDAAMVAA